MLNEITKLSNKIQTYKEILQPVIDKLWNQLKEYKLLEHAYDKKTKDGLEYDRNTKEPIYRMNVERLCFKLYEKPVMCKITKSKDAHPKYRPIETTFKGYAPYLSGNEPIRVTASPEEWDVYPYYEGSSIDNSEQDILNWAQKNRKIYDFVHKMQVFMHKTHKQILQMQKIYAII